MSETIVDTIIIGIGAAGLLSSIYLARKGQKVLCLFKGLGATAMSSGCFDILGYSYKRSDWLSSFTEGYNDLPSEHPYKILSEGDLHQLDSILKEATVNLGELFDKFLYGNYTKNVLIPTIFGTIKPTAYVQVSMKNAILREDTDVLIIGFRDFYEFNPRLVAHMFKTVLKVFDICNIRINYAYLKTQSSTTFPKISLETIVSEIKSILKHKRTDIILFPAIFDSIETVKKIEKELNIHIAELPSTPAYRAGIRLNSFLVNLAEKYGVSLIHADDIKVDLEGRRITRLRVLSHNRILEYKAHNYIIATGDLLGGGLELYTDLISGVAHIKETLLGFEVENVSIENLTKQDFFSRNGHKLSRIGVRINNSARLVDKNGKELVKNAYFVGSIIGGYDYNVEKSGLGVVLVSVWKAVNEIFRGE